MWRFDCGDQAIAFTDSLWFFKCPIGMLGFLSYIIPTSYPEAAHEVGPSPAQPSSSHRSYSTPASLVGHPCFHIKLMSVRTVEDRIGAHFHQPPQRRRYSSLWKSEHRRLLCHERAVDRYLLISRCPIPRKLCRLMRWQLFRARRGSSPGRSKGRRISFAKLGMGYTFKLCLQFSIFVIRNFPQIQALSRSCQKIRVSTLQIRDPHDLVGWVGVLEWHLLVEFLAILCT